MIHPAGVAAVFVSNAGLARDTREVAACSHDGSTVTAPDPFGGDVYHCNACHLTWQPDEAAGA